MSTIGYHTENELDKLANQGKYDEALKRVKSIVEEVLDDESSVASIFGSKVLDAKCLELGQKIWGARSESAGAPEASNSSVIIASHLDKYGGHSKVVEDLLREKPGIRWHLLITNIYDQLDFDYVTKQFCNLASIDVTAAKGLSEKTNWLVEKLIEINPRKIFLFNHHQDVCAIAAIEPYLKVAGAVNYYHHADHKLALGLHLPGATHIDPHCIGYFNCRNNEHISDNQYLPIVVPDRRSCKQAHNFSDPLTITTCSSGTYGKFSAPYKYKYFEVISHMLGASNTKHIHIGNIPDADLERLYEQLERLGIAHDRFVTVPWVESLWDSLLQLKVDLYIGSFPIGGGRALIEAMGAGIPCLMHASLISRFYSGLDLAYEEVLIWHDPAELCDIVNSLNVDVLKSHSIRARQFYEKHYSPAVFSAGLNNLLSKNKTLLIPPPQKDFYSDGLYQYIKSVSQFNKINAFWDLKIQQLNREHSTLKQRFATAYAELNARPPMADGHTDTSVHGKIRKFCQLAKRCIRVGAK